MPAFTDRRDAGRQLAAALAHLRDLRPVVLALPRGGVPVAFEVARALAAPLDVLLVRKIGAPGNPEFGLGALTEGDDMTPVLDPELLRLVKPDRGYLDAEVANQRAAIAERRALYAGARPRIAVAGRVVVLVDDGIATGGTARAALRALRAKRPSRLVLAAPVAAPDSVSSLLGEADEIVTVLQPAWLRSVGEHYGNFQPTEDSEVIQILRDTSDPG